MKKIFVLLFVLLSNVVSSQNLKLSQYPDSVITLNDSSLFDVSRHDSPTSFKSAKMRALRIPPYILKGWAFDNDSNFYPTSLRNLGLDTNRVDTIWSNTQGIGGAIDASALLTLTDTAKGFLVPRMTAVQRNNIASPATGLLVYDTDSSTFLFFDSSVWMKLVDDDGGVGDMLKSAYDINNDSIVNNSDTVNGDIDVSQIVGLVIDDSSSVTYSTDTLKAFNNTNIQVIDSTIFQEHLQTNKSFTVNLGLTTLKGIDATSGNFALDVTDNVDTKMFNVRNDGNIGINQTVPTNLLNIKGRGTTSSTSPILVTNSTVSAKILELYDNQAATIGTRAGVIANFSFTAGSGNEASSTSSFALGQDNDALGLFAGCFGADNIANGRSTIAIGEDNNITGDKAIALGSGHILSADNTFAFGTNNEAAFTFGQVLGLDLKSDAAGAMIMGVGAGIGASRLINSEGYSLMVGYRTTVPTFFVGDAGGGGNLGNVGFFNVISFGGGAKGVLGVGNVQTTPSTNPADMIQIYADDWNGAGTSALFIEGEEGIKHIFGSNVGIGTITPSEKLEVDGNIEGDTAKLEAILFDNGATITNSETDTLFLTETVVKINGNLSVTGGIVIENPHLFMTFSDSAVTLSMTLNNWAQITNAGDSLFGVKDVDGFTVSGDTIIFNETGHYSISSALTYVGDGGNDDQELRWNLDGSQIVKMESSTSNNVDHIAVPLPAFVIATAGDKLWMETRNISDNDDSVIHSGVIVITLAHF